MLCDPLWLNDLYLTTKDHEGFTKVHKGLLLQAPLEGAKIQIVFLLFIITDTRFVNFLQFYQVDVPLI